MNATLSEVRLYLCNNVIAKLPSHYLREIFYRNVMGFVLAPRAAIHLGVRFDAARGFEMGVRTVVNARCRMDTRGSIKLGDNVSISEDVVILTADHDLQDPDFQGRVRPVDVHHRVWIGTRAMVLPGVTIGEGAVVAAGAVVKHDVAPYTVVGGVPARKLGERNRNLRYDLDYRRIFQ
jgi:acetyltransferase-like isoleucine patch superfamily enzyme